MHIHTRASFVNGELPLCQRLCAVRERERERGRGEERERDTHDTRAHFVTRDFHFFFAVSIIFTARARGCRVLGRERERVFVDLLYRIRRADVSRLSDICSV